MAKSRHGSREPKKSKAEWDIYVRNVLKKAPRGPDVTHPFQSLSLDGTEVLESPQDEPTSATAPYHRPRPRSRLDWFRDQVGVQAIGALAAAALIAFVALIVRFEARVTKLETLTEGTLPGADSDNASTVEHLRTDLRSLRERLNRHLDRGSSSE